MTDIVARLGRDLMGISYDDIEAMVREAADEIERLRELVDALRLVASSHEPEALRQQADNERLRALLQDCYKALPNWKSGANDGLLLDIGDALEPKP